jgi:3-oxoacyl-[acyl-carrier-protein] synthase III
MTPRLPLRIAGTSTVLPGTRITTAEIVTRVTPARNAATVESRTGIGARYFAHRDDSPAEVAAQALAAALDAAGMKAEALERIIFVSSGGGDLLFPATGNIVAARLGLAGTCDCFDLNHACMGFLTAFDLAARSIATGSGPVGITVAEFPTRSTTPEDPRPYLVFGDAGAAAVVVPSEDGGGVLGTWLRNDGIAFGNVRLENSAVTRGPLQTISFTAPNDRMAEEAIDAVRRSAGAVLAGAGIEIGDVDWVLPHQPNGALLAAIVAALDIAPERVVPVVAEIGSVGAASIAVSLDRLFRTRHVRSGDRVLMVGVGAGLSSGAILYQHGQ